VHISLPRGVPPFSCQNIHMAYCGRHKHCWYVS